MTITIARPRTKPRRTLAEPHMDHGPALRIARGDVVVVHAADPDQPNRTIRRARVQWVPDVWLAKGTIGQPQHQAAERFAMAYERGILGARDRPIVRVSFEKRAPQGLPDAQLACATDYRQAEQAVGIVLSSALSWCVLSTGTVDGWAQCKGWHRDRAAGYLLASLDRLAEHYGYQPGENSLTRRGM